MKDIKSLLALADPIFKLIGEALILTDLNEAYRIIRETSQPKEWISIGKSEIDGSEYQFNDIELIEGVMNKIFTGTFGYTVKGISHVNDKSRIATTAIVTVKYGFGSGDIRKQGGSATVYCPEIKTMILGTPKAVSQAKKNACKYIGKLLGLDLNREQEELPIVSVKAEPSEMDIETEKELELLRQQIKAASTKELAQKLLDNSPFRLMPDLKILVNQKIN